jgi:hypothetical protein
LAGNNNHQFLPENARIAEKGDRSNNDLQHDAKGNALQARNQQAWFHFYLILVSNVLKKSHRR